MSLLAVDPGREKSGIAVISKKDAAVLYKDIIKTPHIDRVLKETVQNFEVDLIIVGDGTSSENIWQLLKADDQLRDIEKELIEEQGSTRRAEKLYRQQHSSFLKKLLFKIVSWKPDQELDDLTAVILGREYIKNNLSSPQKKK